MTIKGINHITLKTCDIDRADRFFTKVLGLKKVGQRPGMRFYSSGQFHHELALMQDSTALESGRGLLAHICFNVADESSLMRLYQRCQDEGQAVSALIDHTIMHSFYLRAPDGYFIEIGVDCPKADWKDHPSPFDGDSLLSTGLGPYEPDSR